MKKTILSLLIPCIFLAFQFTTVASDTASNIATIINYGEIASLEVGIDKHQLSKVFTFSPTIPYKDFVSGQWSLKLKGSFADYSWQAKNGVVITQGVEPDKSVCGDSIYEDGETTENCPADSILLTKTPIFGEKYGATPVCGNGICEEGENVVNCAEDCKFGFGLGYIHPELAEDYGSLGTSWGKTTQIAWSWIEPDSPTSKGVHNYNFSILDEHILSHQNNGFKDFHVWLVPDAEWAVFPVEDRCVAGVSDLIARPLLDEHEQDFYDFIYNLVERYDKDGIDDLPGLIYPVTHFEIISEAQYDFYFCVPEHLSKIEEYEKILSIAYAAAKEANPNSKIILSGIAINQVFNGLPSREEVRERLAQYEEAWPGIVEFIEQSLNLTDYYDVIELHLLEDSYDPYAFIRWIREDLGINKPVWAGDATPDSYMHSGFGLHPIFTIIPPLYPNGDMIFESVDRVKISKYSTLYPHLFPGELEPTSFDILVEKWYRKKQAKELVKKVVVAAGSGYKGINIQSNFDWPIPWRYSPYWTREWAWMALAEIDDLFANPDPNREMDVEYYRPSFYAYQKLIEKTKGFSEVEKIDSEEGVFIYKFIVNGEKIFVVWYDDFIAECPTPICETDKEASITIDLSPYILTSNANIFHIVTELDENNNPIYPADEIVPANSIMLTETPTFVKEYNTTSVNEINLTGENIKIYPNPTNGIFIIEADNNLSGNCRIQSVKILNISGQIVKKFHVSSSRFQVDLSKQPKGAYFVKIKSDNYINVKKIVIQ